MSCFINSDNAINGVFQTVSKLYYKDFSISFNRKYPYLYSLMDDRQKVLNKLYVLNCFSFRENYKKRHKFDIKHKPIVNSVLLKNLAQEIKNLQCYLYQSCEGRARKTQLYKELEKIENSLIRDFLYQSKDYENAEWGI